MKERENLKNRKQGVADPGQVQLKLELELGFNKFNIC